MMISQTVQEYRVDKQATAGRTENNSTSLRGWSQRPYESIITTHVTSLFTHMTTLNGWACHAGHEPTTPTLFVRVDPMYSLRR